MSYQFEQISVLVVEDVSPVAFMIRSVLETFGVRKIHVARNGEEGFELYCRHKHDIVIADWMMKPTDGVTLTRMIREDRASPNPYAPIILMTGFSEKKRVMQARDAGVTEFLVKPFVARDLYKRLVQVTERPRQFVRSYDYFGPDRRRKITEPYTGTQRRASDFIDGVKDEQR